MGTRLLPFGDAAILVEIGTAMTIASARRARAVAAAIDVARSKEPALGSPVAAAASVLVPFDPLLIDHGGVAALLEPLLDTPPRGPAADAARAHEIPVRYGGADGPDLDAVADATGLRPEDVVEVHAGQAYEVLFLGFAPGFAYLGEVHARLIVPRLATPRVRVPAGSVAITGSMTAVYPQASPGGWRILGRTDTVMFDPGAAPPARLRPGDRVRFVPAR